MRRTPLHPTIDLILGVDGGGSRTRALLADPDGALRGAGESGAANHRSVGFAAAAQALTDAIEMARRAAGVPAGAQLRAACFGLAGAGRPEDRARFRAWAEAAGIAQQYVFVNDAELVLAAGTPAGWGLALIAGTGSFCWGRAPDGRTTRVGGWGYLLGDEGGGYDLALQVMRLATQTADGRAEAHALLQMVLGHWGLDDPTQLIEFTYRPELTRATIADLARPLLALADTGDPAARQIVERAASELGRLVQAATARLELRQPPLATAGGLLGASELLRRLVAAHADVPIERLQFVDEPAQGALRLALASIEQERA